MDNLDLLECCQSVLNFIQDKDEVLINFTESETMKEMDRVLVKNQTAGADNGIYVVAAGASNLSHSVVFTTASTAAKIRP